MDTETPLTTAPLKKCRSYEEVELYAAAPVSGYGHADDKVTFTYDLRRTLSATVKDGAVLGTATVYLDGYEVGTVDLVTHQEYVSDFRTDPQSTLLLMAALIVLLAVLSFFTLVAGLPESGPAQKGEVRLHLRLANARQLPEGGAKGYSIYSSIYPL